MTQVKIFLKSPQGLRWARLDGFHAAAFCVFSSREAILANGFLPIPELNQASVLTQAELKNEDICCNSHAAAVATHSWQSVMSARMRARANVLYSKNTSANTTTTTAIAIATTNALGIALRGHFVTPNKRTS